MSPPIRRPRLAEAKIAAHKEIVQPVEVGRRLVKFPQQLHVTVAQFLARHAGRE